MDVSRCRNACCPAVRARVCRTSVTASGYPSAEQPGGTYDCTALRFVGLFLDKRFAGDLRDVRWRYWGGSSAHGPPRRWPTVPQVVVKWPDGWEAKRRPSQAVLTALEPLKVKASWPRRPVVPGPAVSWPRRVAELRQRRRRPRTTGGIARCCSYCNGAAIVVGALARLSGDGPELYPLRKGSLARE